MRPKRIILIRHAESEGNVDSRVYEHIPDHRIELTENGIKEAQKAGKSLKKIIGSESVQFYVSPCARSWNTYSEIIKTFSENNTRVYEEPRIREQDFGNFQSYDKIQEKLLERHQYGRFFYRFPNGESGADVYDRISSFLESLHRGFEKEIYLQNVIIVSHGLTIRLFLMRWLHWRVDYFEKLDNPNNCEYFILEKQNDEKFQLITKMRKREGFHDLYFKM